MSIPIKTLTLPISSGGSTTETEYSFITPEDMDEKANVDGYYENLVSGGTEQLLSSVYEEDSEPYLFRTSGGSIDIGDREEDTIVGGTIAWNQIYQTHTSFSTTADLSGLTINVANGFIDVTGSTANEGRIQVFPVTRAIPANHVCLMLCDGWNGFSWRRNGFAPVEKDYFMNRHSADWDAFAAISVSANTTYNIHARFSSYDLTQMFGSTIADYIYNLEQSTAGAGVAFFRKLFPKPYYAYDAESLKSVEGLSEHVTVGFNQWDEEWELGTYNETTGAPNSGNQNIRSKNFIPVISGQNYYFASPQNMVRLGYDADKNYIGKIGVDTPNVVRTIPENCAYIKFYMYKAYGTTYNNDICINLHWDGERDGEYEPYKKRSYPLDSSLVLRGIFKLDENNKLRCDGDVYHADGTVERKYGIVDLGSLTWSYRTGSGLGDYFYAVFNEIRYAGSFTSTKYPIVCSKYTTTTRSQAFSDKCITVDGADATQTPSQIQIKDSAYSDAATFKTAMSGVYLVYELAEPTTEQAEPYTNPQIVDDFGTEEYVTDSIVPVGHVTKYMPNLKAKLEMAPDSPSDNGDYIVRHTNGQNEYVPLVIPTELPTMPSEDGTYHLKVTVTNGTAVLSWEGE